MGTAASASTLDFQKLAEPWASTVSLALTVSFPFTSAATITGTITITAKITSTSSDWSQIPGKLHCSAPWS